MKKQKTRHDAIIDQPTMRYSHSDEGVWHYDVCPSPGLLRQMQDEVQEFDKSIMLYTFNIY